MSLRLRVWWSAARPKTLGAAVVPVAVGSAVAATAGAFQPGLALAALAGALLIQIGTNLVNDAGDFARGADDGERLGPVRAVASGALSVAGARAGAAVAFLAAAAAGLVLVRAAGWPVVAIGVTSIAAGIAYTAGPWPLAYVGLGDAFVLLFFGLVAVSGTAWIQLYAATNSLVAPTNLSVAAAIPVGALATVMIAINNLRDRHGDARAGKRTLAVRLGRRAVVVEVALLLAIALVVPAALALSRGPWLLLPLATAPLAWRLLVGVAGGEGSALNAELARAGRLLWLYGATFSAALWMSAA